MLPSVGHRDTLKVSETSPKDLGLAAKSDSPCIHYQTLIREEG